MMDAARREITMAVDSALDTLNRQRDAGLEEVKRRIQEEVVANKGSINSETQEALILLEPKLAEMQERAVNEALEAFRARVSQFLGASPRPGDQ